MIAPARVPFLVAYSGYAPASWTNVYTVEGTFNSSVGLRGMFFCNTGAEAATFSVAVRGASGTLGDSDWLMISGKELSAGETYFLPESAVGGIILGNGEMVDIIASVASTVATRICVEEQI